VDRDQERRKTKLTKGGLFFFANGRVVHGATTIIGGPHQMSKKQRKWKAAKKAKKAAKKAKKYEKEVDRSSVPPNYQFSL
jgi:hypothetical protein